MATDQSEQSHDGTSTRRHGMDAPYNVQHSGIIFQNPIFVGTQKQTLFRIKFGIYNFLEYPKTYYQRGYHIFIFLLTLTGFILSILSIIKPNSVSPSLNTYIGIQIILLAIYITEYILRSWACSINERYKNFRRICYLLTPYMLIDIFIIATGIPIIIFYYSGQDMQSDVVLFLRFVQILSFFRFERFHGSVRLMTKVLYVHKSELLTGYCCALMLILFTSFIIYIIEMGQQNNIHSMSDSVYFTVISFLTIGYGDIVPTSYLSRITIVISAFLGVALAAVPSGIIGSGFALQVSNRNKRRHKREIIKPAIIYIQRAARFYLYLSPGSATETRDFLRTINNPKNKSFNKRELNSQFERAQTPEVGKDSHSDKKAEMGNIRDVSASLSKISQLPKVPIQQIFQRFKIIRRSSIIPETGTDDMRTLVSICCKFIRYLQLVESERKFKNAKHPASVEELIENLENKQKTMNYYIQNICENIKVIKMKNKSHGSVQNIACQKCDRLNTQIDQLSYKISSLEECIRNLIRKTSKTS